MDTEVSTFSLYEGWRPRAGWSVGLVWGMVAPLVVSLLGLMEAEAPSLPLRVMDTEGSFARLVLLEDGGCWLVGVMEVEGSFA